MALHNINPKKTKAWKKLEDSKNLLIKKTLKDLFNQEDNRLDYLSVELENIYVDFSKNIIDENTFNLLLDLASECKVEDSIKKLFDGELINETEKRAVLHTSLRNFKSAPDSISKDRKKIEKFSSDIINGKIKSSTGKRFTDVVNIGIGGSDLGPKMTVEALKFYKNNLNIHFISNVDGDHANDILKDLNPETTFFIIVSKTFTTQETLSNAVLAKNWIENTLKTKKVDKK